MSVSIFLSDALTDAAVFTDGDWVESKDQDPNGDVRLTQLADIGDGYWVNKSARYLTSEKAKQLRCTYLRAGDVLVARMPDPLGRSCIFPGDPMPCVTVVDVCAIRPNPKTVYNRYLMHVINSPVGRQGIANFVTGTTRQRISRKNLGKIQIPLPPLEEQKRIAGILDAADALRVRRRESLAQLDTLLQSTFLEMFGDPVTNPMGWEMVDFENIIFFQEGPGVRKWQFRDAGIKLINVKNIVSGNLCLENTSRHLDPEEVTKKYNHFLLDKGDLVMSSSGVTWGKIAYVKEQHLPLCLNTSMIRLRPRDARITHAFIRAFVESQSFRRQILRIITGSAQPNFGPSHLRQIAIGLPPIELQQRFAAIVESVEQQKAAQRAHLDELDTLFACLQQRAFAGELVA